MSLRVVGSILACGLMLAGNTAAQDAATLAELKQQAIQEVDKRQTFTQQMVDQIYSYSELGFQEVETSRQCRHPHRVGGELRQRQTGDRLNHRY
jgi:hypothetical protein